MSDRELLELAAKAAGVEINYSTTNGGGFSNTGFDIVGNAVLDWHNGTVWNPLTDDGDALRLAVKLMMSVEISAHEESTYAYAGDVPRVYAYEMWRDDKDAATRRAIVRSAAEIGKMKGGKE